MLWQLCVSDAVPLRAIKTQPKPENVSYPRCAQTDCTVYTNIKCCSGFDGALTLDTKKGMLYVNTKCHVEELFTGFLQYFLTVVENYSWYIFFCLIFAKRGASDSPVTFHQMVWDAAWPRFENHPCGRRGRNPGKPKSGSRLKPYRVNFTTVIAYIPQSNGLIERTHRKGLELARASLIEAILQPKYWIYAVKHSKLAKALYPTAHRGKCHTMTSLTGHHLTYRTCALWNALHYTRRSHHYSIFSGRYWESHYFRPCGRQHLQRIDRFKFPTRDHVRMLETMFPGTSSIAGKHKIYLSLSCFSFHPAFFFSSYSIFVVQFS